MVFGVSPGGFTGEAHTAGQGEVHTSCEMAGRMGAGIRGVGWARAAARVFPCQPV